MDPLIVAQSIAYTPVNDFVPLENIISNTREGIKGIGGIQTRGQYRFGMPGL
jgi:spore coat assembly protein